MIELENLRVSLTKNGYLKVATIVAAHPSHEMLNHVYGSHQGVNLNASQVANVLCADPATGVVPGFWDEVRQYDRATIRAFTFIAIVYSHHRLIELFASAGHGTPRGTISRTDFDTVKEYTNLAFALAEVEAAPYVRGAGEVHYDLSPVVEQLSDLGYLVARLLKAKLRRCGWRDPEEFIAGADLPLAEQCREERFHEVLGMSYVKFANWINTRPKKPK
jgi:hypothetical protein